MRGGSPRAPLRATRSAASRFTLSSSPVACVARSSSFHSRSSVGAEFIDAFSASIAFSARSFSRWNAESARPMSATSSGSWASMISWVSQP